MSQLQILCGILFVTGSTSTDIMKNLDINVATDQLKEGCIKTNHIDFYNENASVIYTNGHGQKFDTFVIFATDRETGLTHINHENLQVSAGSLALHPKSISKFHLPIDDAFSFEMLKKLKEKHEKRGKPLVNDQVKINVPMKLTWAKAS